MAGSAGPVPTGYGITSQLRKGLRYFFTEQLMAGFAGGLNLRDAPTELKPNESPNCWNVTLDERGGVVKRLGYTAWNQTPAAALIKDSYYSTVASKLLWYANSSGILYYDTGDGDIQQVVSHTWTTGSRVSMVDFAGAVYLAHPADGLWSSTDGVTWAAVVAASGSIPNGDLACVWQNKLWVSGNNGLRVYFSAAGDATKWASADGGGTVDVREKDDSPIVAIAGGAGFDLQTQPGLFVFKHDSTYRIYDSTTGAYLTIDPAIGAASKNSVVGMFGELFVLGRRGIYGTKKLAALVPLASQIFPLFDPSQLDDTTMANWCGGYNGDRIYFSMTKQGSSINNIALEYAPLYGWVVAASNAMGCYQTLAGNAAEVLIGADPNTPGQLFELNTGGSDNGADITSWFETRWFQVLNGHKARMNLMRLLARGVSLDVSVFADFVSVEGAPATAYKSETVTTSSGLIWGSGSWGVDLYEQPVESYVDVYPRQLGRAFKVRIDETSSRTYQPPEFFPEFGEAPDGGEVSEGAPVKGAWALYAVDGQYAPLGLS